MLARLPGGPGWDLPPGWDLITALHDWESFIFLPCPAALTARWQSVFTEAQI